MQLSVSEKLAILRTEMMCLFAKSVGLSESTVWKIVNDRENVIVSEKN